MWENVFSGWLLYRVQAIYFPFFIAPYFLEKTCMSFTTQKDK